MLLGTRRTGSLSSVCPCRESAEATCSSNARQCRSTASRESLQVTTRSSPACPRNMPRQPTTWVDVRAMNTDPPECDPAVGFGPRSDLPLISSACEPIHRAREGGAANPPFAHRSDQTLPLSPQTRERATPATARPQGFLSHHPVNNTVGLARGRPVEAQSTVDPRGYAVVIRPASRCEALTGVR